MSESRHERDEDRRDESDVSRAYRRLKSPRVPAQIDQKIRDAARHALSEAAQNAEGASPRARRMRDINHPVVRKPSWFAPFSAAASVILCAAVLLAIAFDPHAHRHKEEKVKIIPAVSRHELGQRQLYSSDPPNSRPSSTDGAQMPPMPVEVRTLDPQEWLARIDTLRHSGQVGEAAAELAEFRRVFPDYRIPTAIQSFR